MTLQWTVVAAFLYLEIFIIGLLLLPWIRPNLWNKLFRSRLATALSAYSAVYLWAGSGILFLLFFDAIREVRKYSLADMTLEAHVAAQHADTVIHMRLFRAQRNLYISGFALFLWFVIRRLVGLIGREAQLQATAEAAMRQASGASAAATRAMDDSSGGGEIKQLQSKVEDLENELQRVNKDRDAMKTQAENLQNEYDRLAEELGRFQAEADFTGRQESRRSAQSRLSDVQDELKSVHVQLDKTQRGDDSYLDLLMHEHKLVKRERSIRVELTQAEYAERKAFERFSAALRDSHEREREQGEKTKYWSLVGSIIGATVGVIGTTINNRYRMRELRNLVSSSTTDNASSVAALVNKLTDAVRSQQEQTTTFLQELQQTASANKVLQLLGEPDVRESHAQHRSGPQSSVGTLPSSSEAWRKAHEATTHEIQVCTQTLLAKLEDTRAMIAGLAVGGRGFDSESEYVAGATKVIFVGQDLAELVESSSLKAEQRMKVYVAISLAAVATVCFILNRVIDR